MCCIYTWIIYRMFIHRKILKIFVYDLSKNKSKVRMHDIKYRKYVVVGSNVGGS